MDTAPLLDHLENNDLGTKGIDLFRDNMPSTDRVPRGILVTNQTMTKIHPYVSNYVHGVFEVVAREDTFDKARETMNNVIDVMSSDGGLQLGDMCFLYIRALNTPLVYPVSDASLVEGSVLFDFRFTL